ncbi:MULTISPECIES: site-specific integrase [Marinobacter]|jgi:site-specific recombinase XerD|uniref:Site-specific integrase n=1 Tax=Marinobacter metalliresistant TaxID=2961995 RepID=A0ABZ2W2B9_9GAMM|nr:site-specific integrase [Marinobacter sp.]MAK49225.1 integrase [Marinobacter sp.]MAO28498.1 integrase [Roseovarius sp.]|tara:strand:- start:876 stop:1727 length:852 start_codon:yes stop_codon:yes gene_type:complete
MTPLRQTMIQAMCQHGFSPRTQQSYLYVVTELARYYRRSPDQLQVDDLQVYFNYLVQERALSPASCRLYLHGIRFLYLQVLHWAHFDVTLVLPKRPQRIPELLTRQEVSRLLAGVSNPKHQALLSIIYGCGLRVSEAVALQVKDLDGERHLLRVAQGKGAKDRMVPLAPGLLQVLRQYWRIRRPMPWLFPSDLLPDKHLHITTPQKVFHQAKRASGIHKRGGIHALRHAYATHQLEQGVPLHELQRLLGHSDLRSTQRYLHWLPGVTPQNRGPVDLIAGLGGG